MRKIAAHYILTFHGEAVKNGIVHIDDSGLIQKISSSSEFLHEERALEYFSGVIIPDLAIYCKYFDSILTKGNTPHNKPSNTIHSLETVLKSQGCSTIFVEWSTELINNFQNLKAIPFNSLKPKLLTPEFSTWETMSADDELQELKRFSMIAYMYRLQTNLGINLIDLLQKLHGLWEQQQPDVFINSLREGQKAAVNLISGIDYSSFKLTPESTIRRLV